jgi:hypothetical protein
VLGRKCLFSKIRSSFYDGEAVYALMQYNKYSGFTGVPGNYALFARF